MPEFDVTCIGKTERGECTLGDTLAFKFVATVEKRYVAAFAKQMNGDIVVWYFPAKETDGCMPISSETSAPGIHEGIVIGEEHGHGDFEVYGVFSGKPCNREDIRRLFDSAALSNNKEFTILKRTLQVR